MLEEKLLSLLETQGNSFLTAREIRKSLGISQVTLLKSVERLESFGYQLAFAPPNRYYLKEHPDLLNSMEIRSGLHTSLLGKEIHFFKETGSTNDVALSLALAGAKDGTAVVAESQSFGRGRLGRRWESSPFVNIYTSLVLRPGTAARYWPDFTLVAGVAAAQAIRTITGLPAGLLWPNDIVLGDKKVGGILTEMNQTGEKLNFIVLGIGINVNATQEALFTGVGQKATSLRQEGGKAYSRVALLQALYEELERDYFLYQEKGLSPLIAGWQCLSKIEGKEVRVQLPRGSYCGLALGLDDEGALLMRTKEGGLLSVPSGQLLKLELR